MLQNMRGGYREEVFGGEILANPAYIYFIIHL